MKTRYLFGLPFATFTLYQKEMEFLIDTGFNGAILIPKESIRELKLEPLAVTQYALANGSIATARIYEAELDWFGSKRKVAAISGDSDFTLLGMELLKDAKATLIPSRNLLSLEPV